MAAAAAAAVVLFALATVVLLNRHAARQSGAEPLRGRGAASEAAVAPKTDSRLDAPPREFAWKAPAGASRSRVRLFDASGNRLWESEPLAEARTALPEGVGSALKDGSYFWTVDVETPAGAEKLGPFPFDLARR
jgi:hypothetical protein